MESEEMRKIMDNIPEYDDSREEDFGSLVTDLYRSTRSTQGVLIWAYCIFFFVLGIASAVFFFFVDETKYQIMLAALFLFFMQRAALVKTMAWQRIHRNSVKREIKRLEIQIAGLSQIVKCK